MFTYLKEWLYFLQDKEGRSYRVNNNQVDKIGTPTFLPTSPDGWQEKSIRWGRSAKYYGMIRSYSTPLKFVKQGAHIIRDVLYKLGFEAQLFLVIHKLDKRFGQGLVHKLFYKGEIDLSKATDSPDTVTVNILEGGLDALIKANEGTIYDIPMDSPGVVILEHDGIPLQTKGNFRALDGVDIDNAVYGVNYMAPVFNVSTEGQAFGITYQNQYLEGIAGSGFANEIEYLVESSNWYARNTSLLPIEINLSGKVIVEVVDNDVNGGFTLRWMTSTQTEGNQDIYNFTGVVTAGVPGTIHEFTFDQDITLQPGEKLYLRGALIFPTGAENLTIKFNEGSNFSAYVVTRFATERYNAFNPVTLGQLLLDKIAGPGYTFASTPLGSDWKGLLITSGDALRGFETAKLRTSWNDFWKAMNSVVNLEMHITGTTVYFEAKANAFGGTTVANLGDVKVEDEKGFKVAEEFIFNTVKVGYPNSQVEDANGRYEVNVTQQWTTPLVRIVKELDLVCPYSASIYDIEYTRINFDGKESTNSDTDTTVFLIHCNNSPVLDDSGLFFKYTIRRDTYDSITGVFDPESCYNIEISPKRNLLRHGNFIRGGLYFEDAGYLVFQGSDKNADLETVNNATLISPEIRIKESTNIRISTLDSPLFIPFEFTGECPAPIGIADIMENTPTERFSFRYRGQTYTGFPLEVAVQPADNAPQETRLLLTPGNNVQNLIHG